MRSMLITAILLAGGQSAFASDSDPNDSVTFTLPPVEIAKDRKDTGGISDYPSSGAADRVSLVISKNERGTSRDIPIGVISKLCGDIDGCQVRIGMHNWDDTGRVASREFIFFYNSRNGVWRASLGDSAGTDKDNVVSHVNQSWSCYLTDGKYKDWVSQGDAESGFGLLSWNQYNADCFITFID